MNRIFTFLLTILILTSCNEGKKSDKNKTTDTFVNTTYNNPQSSPLLEKLEFDCPTFLFKSAGEQADTLIKYFDKKELATDKIFFCAFPNSFEEMQAVFGYNDNKGAAPLYSNGANIIKYFAKLNNIPKDIYYEKYINICVNGKWEADNINEAFGFADRLKSDPEAASIALTKRNDKDIKEVFHFIFDGPHPKNEENEKIYKELLPLLTTQNERLGKLFTDTYKQIVSEDHGH